MTVAVHQLNNEPQLLTNNNKNNIKMPKNMLIRTQIPKSETNIKSAKQTIKPILADMSGYNVHT